MTPVSQLAVWAVPEHAWFGGERKGEPLYRLEWMIDGCPLLDALLASEDRQRALDEWPLRRGYYLGPFEYWRAASQELPTIRPARESREAGILAVCNCGEPSCFCVVCDVERSAGTVCWTNIRAANEDIRYTPGTDVSGEISYSFDAEAYDRAFAEVIRLEGPVTAIMRASKGR